MRKRFELTFGFIKAYKDDDDDLDDFISQQNYEEKVCYWSYLYNKPFIMGGKKIKNKSKNILLVSFLVHISNF